MTMFDESQIRQSACHQIDTVRDDNRSATEVTMLASAASSDGQSHQPVQRLTSLTRRRYLAPMTTSANSVIAAIDQRRPNQSDDRKHLLLFFCQGHHLALTGNPMFAEPMYATPSGVRVEIDDAARIEPITNRQFGTLGYVVRRYAGMDNADLQSLVQVSSAWQLARRVPDETRIEWMWLTDWFNRPSERAGKPTAEEAADFAARQKVRLGG